MKRITFLLLFVCLAALGAYAQVPMDVQVRIVKAEDARRYDKELESLMSNPNTETRTRAALAAGRIGKEDALPKLTELLEKDPNIDVRIMAAFAIGEVESIKGADALLAAIRNTKNPTADADLMARLLEAAGKIAAANAKDEKAKELGTAIVEALNTELNKKTDSSVDVARLGLTAVLRARPAGAEETVRKFLAYTDPNIVADALNTLARLRAKNANRDARDLLQTNVNAVVRANAARVLGGSEDKEAVDVLIKAATTDKDSRVRVSAIRTLAAIKDTRAADPLIERGFSLIDSYNSSKFRQPSEKNEFLEIAAALGRLKQATGDEKTFSLLAQFGRKDKYSSPETEIALARIDPNRFVEYSKQKRIELKHTWRALAGSSQAFATFAQLDDSEANKTLKSQTVAQIREAMDRIAILPDNEQPRLGIPELMRAYAAFKPADAGEVLRGFLDSDDVFIRATAAELLGDLPSTPENFDTLNSEFDYAFQNDVKFDDAVLATIDALFKLDKRKSLSALAVAAGSPDQLVRRKALELLKDDAFKGVETLDAALKYSADKRMDEVKPFSGKGTKMGQLLNTDADYRRAVSRKNGHVKAIVTTQKGPFTIDLLPEDAPLTVDNFVKLARANYFNGLEVHRVVPNFVMQDGDPRGDGNGGPGWSVRCEINMVPYERGAVGMALSGKDTGGSQWFVTHSPQPHLDGGYTVFGKVNETGMKVVDNIVRGDRIVSIRIIETTGKR